MAPNGKNVIEKSVLPLSAGVFTDNGNKTVNEDRFVAFPDLSKFALEGKKFPFRKHFYAMYAVYDGHGGETSADFLKTHLHHNIVEELCSVKDFSVDSDVRSEEHIEYVKNVLANAFHKTDTELLSDLKSKGESDGSTALVVLVVDSVLWVANVGDSKAILTIERENGSIKVGNLSKEHKPNFLEERRRIKKCGGFVKNGRVLDKLAVSRSFGDPTFKQYGVVPTPYISRVEVYPTLDRFLLIGCDGLWAYLPGKTAAEFALKKFKHFSKPNSGEVSRALVKEAVIDRLTSDNVTALVVEFRERDEGESDAGDK